MSKTRTRLMQSAILVLYIVTFAHAGLDKLLLAQTPDWFLQQFSGTFLNLFEGSLALQFYGIGLVETLIAALLLLAIALPKWRHRFAFGGLFLALLLFIALGFGQRLTGQYEGAASLFVYAAVTFFILRNFDEHDA